MKHPSKPVAPAVYRPAKPSFMPAAKNGALIQQLRAASPASGPPVYSVPPSRIAPLPPFRATFAGVQRAISSGSFGVARFAPPASIGTVQRSTRIIQRQKLPKETIRALVTGNVPLGKDTLEKYIPRLQRKVVPRQYTQTDWDDSVADITSLAKTMYFPEAVKEIVVTTIATVSGLSMSRIQGITPSVLVATVKAYMDSSYLANGTHGDVSKSGNRAKVYDLGDGTWGYADTAHGEIEVIAENQKSGTTLGFRSMIWSVETTTTGSNVKRVPEVTGVRALAAGGKPHDYSINNYR
jgi:hypothetical protein